MKSVSQFLIAAPSSGSGKTTIARGLMRLFVRQGMEVHPFKCGPDYIDTKFHAEVCGHPSVNLDTFMASKEHVRALYAHYAGGADVCVVEGMMGLYDGYDRDKGSTAEIAETLGLPVVLVVDAQSAAYSVAPLLSGFMRFKEEVRIAGVLFNRVGSPRHYALLQQACADLHIACFGYLPKHAELEQPSRYLGLDFSRDDQALDLLVRQLEAHVDWKRLLESTVAPLPPREEGQLFEWPFAKNDKAFRRMLVARSEESFSFIYQEHIDILHRAGEVRFFNPEENVPIPDDTDLLYLPGGYPEKHSEVLQKAADTRRSIRKYAEGGGNVLAECGGMMYLCKTILQEEGEAEMVGVLPYTITARKADRRLALGYRRFPYEGRMFRGHEFHYSQFFGEAPASEIQVYDAKGGAVPTPVFRQGNVLASYTHLYWGT